MATKKEKAAKPRAAPPKKAAAKKAPPKKVPAKKAPAKQAVAKPRPAKPIAASQGPASAAPSRRPPAKRPSKAGKSMPAQEPWGAASFETRDGVPGIRFNDGWLPLPDYFGQGHKLRLIFSAPRADGSGPQNMSQDQRAYLLQYIGDLQNALAMMSDCKTGDCPE